MTAGNDLRQEVIDAQNKDISDAADFLGVFGSGRKDILDSLEILSEFGDQKLDNLSFLKEEENFVGNKKRTRLIVGSSTFLGEKGFRKATVEELRKGFDVKLNADAMTASQFKQVVQDFLDFLVSEDFIVTSLSSDKRVDVKVSWT